MNTLGQAGAERALIELLNRLLSDGYEVDLLVLIPRGELFEALPSDVHLLNPSYSSGSLFSQAGRRYLIGFSLSALFKHGNIIKELPTMLRVMMKERKISKDKLMWHSIANSAMRLDTTYDLAIAFVEGGSTYYVAKYVQAKQKAAFVHIDYQVAGYSVLLDRDCYNEMSHIFCVSKEVQSSFIQIHPEQADKTHLFYNMLNQTSIRQLAHSDATLFDPSLTNLVTIARLHPQKGLDLAIDALALLKKKGYQVKWYVCGEGPLRKELELHISSLGLEEDFILLGFKDNPYPYIQQATIYVQPSLFEGKSIAIEEAQTLHKAVVATHCSGVDSQIHHDKDGIICDKDATSIALALQDYLDHPEKRLRHEQYSQTKQWDFETHYQTFKQLMHLEK